MVGRYRVKQQRVHYVDVSYAAGHFQEFYLNISNRSLGTDFPVRRI